MRGSLYRITLMFISALLCGSAFAQQSSNWVSNGYSFNFAVGAGLSYYAPNHNFASTHDADHSPFAFSLSIDKKLSRHTGISLGYNNYGTYENETSGYLYCTLQGKCTYPAADASKGVFKTLVNANNSISSQSYYLAMLLKYRKHAQTFYSKVGISYFLANIDSRAIASVTIDGITVDGAVDAKEKNHTLFLPILILGWKTQLTPLVSTNLSLNWNYKVAMFERTGHNTGTLYPAALLFGLSYQL